MKFKKIIISAIIMSMCCGLTACTNSYEFTYRDDSYKASDVDDVFNMSWDMLSLVADMDEILQEELPEKNVKFDGEKLKGLFEKDIDLVVEDEDDNGDVSEAVFDAGEYDLSDLIETYGEKYKTEDGNAYFVPYQIECEIEDEELWVEAIICSEEADSWFDYDLISYVTFSFDLK